MASRSIRFTKAEWAAVKFAGEHLGDSIYGKAFDSLLAKMDAASAPREDDPAGLSPGVFLEIAAREIQGVVIQEPRTPAYYGRIGKALRDSGIRTAADAVDLCKSVAGWARGSISAVTIAMKGGEWLARARSKPAGGRAAPPASLFEEDDEADVRPGGEGPG